MRTWLAARAVAGGAQVAGMVVVRTTVAVIAIAAAIAASMPHNVYKERPENGRSFVQGGCVMMFKERAVI